MYNTSKHARSRRAATLSDVINAARQCRERCDTSTQIQLRVEFYRGAKNTDLRAITCHRYDGLGGMQRTYCGSSLAAAAAHFDDDVISTGDLVMSADATCGPDEDAWEAMRRVLGVHIEASEITSDAGNQQVTQHIREAKLSQDDMVVDTSLAMNEPERTLAWVQNGVQVVARLTAQYYEADRVLSVYALAGEVLP